MSRQALFKAVAAVASAVSAMTLMAVPALAADTQIPSASLTKVQPLTVTASEDISAKTLKAVPLANYSAATTNGTDITGFDLSDAGHASQVDKALTSAGIAHATEYNASNPMQWVSKNLLDSASSPYAGKLRNLLTALAKDGSLASGSDAVALAKGANAQTMTANVRPGIWLIVDATAKGKASLPMLVGTGIDGKTTLRNGDATMKLGTVEYKPNSTTVSKKILTGGQETDSSKNAIGSTVSYRLKTTVPNWTGYGKFQLKLSDTLGKGLTYSSVTKVTVGGADLDKTLYKVNGPTADNQLEIVFSPDASGVSDLIAHKDKFPVGAAIVVEYNAILNKDALISTGQGLKGNPNSVSVQYSHNPNVSTDLETVPGNTVNTYTGRFLLVKHDSSGAPLADATFNITAAGATSPLNLVQVSKATDNQSANVYRPALAGEQGSPTITTPASGLVTVQGLQGSYTVAEKSSPFGTALLPSFTLQIDAAKDGKNQIVQFNGDANKLATSTIGQETVTVVNVRNLAEMPKTGAAWMAVFAIGAGLCATGAGLLLSRRRV
ncbi:hypothetical protein BW14_08660 [Bifidobacterium sp. UTBIF-68]|uniref:isopeptide-forming domain-containing fimbrial protein n=1 Tax=Bifidobacterium sp. UTBIF-68 TaxID=1465262 RepID=UPI00112BEF45|nr:isopeptide-forming domain-containing fimbrial protein [Bifidobacterium sp. UTBIF-68]TPF92484.1 hypothetical protein BW14_08660 [Bifidobacterium sp. UTBIF-68]